MFPGIVPKSLLSALLLVATLPAPAQDWEAKLREYLSVSPEMAEALEWETECRAAFLMGAGEDRPVVPYRELVVDWAREVSRGNSELVEWSHSLVMATRRRAREIMKLLQDSSDSEKPEGRKRIKDTYMLECEIRGIKFLSDSG